MDRRTFSSNTPWERAYGYSRAVRAGPFVFVAGTLASDAEGNLVGVGDARTQTTYVLEKIESALNELGARRADVVRTRIYVTDMYLGDEIGRAHGAFFAHINPACTMVQVAALAHPAAFVEIEADAIVGD
ncbi:RidA family protein [Candidatus Poribacteria bacterium]|nr:RidA family protein [Candidatus Poribacteria bacterium]